ncbi:MAG: mycofactocin biosynthesis glycosyltransferase MftF, partial [Solirubrobacteraceae bacterium]
QAWAPPLVALVPCSPRVRRALLAAYAIPVARAAGDALRCGEPGALPADAALALVDELAALAGTWEGCARRRTLGPLLPSIRLAP